MAIVTSDWTEPFDDDVSTQDIMVRLLLYLQIEKRVDALRIEYSSGRAYGKKHDAFPAPFVADVMCCKGMMLWEFEIKRTWSDFLADFKKGSYIDAKEGICGKHKILLEGKGPNKFWFVVPRFRTGELINKVEEYIKQDYPKYGLIVVGKNGCVSWRQCRSLHENVNEYVVDAVKKTQVYTITNLARRFIREH